MSGFLALAERTERHARIDEVEYIRELLRESDDLQSAITLIEWRLKELQEHP